MARNFLGRCYVSLDWALAYDGLIPESVQLLTSVTTKRRKLFEAPLGDFEYRPWGDGTPHLQLTPLELAERMVAHTVGYPGDSQGERGMLGRVFAGLPVDVCEIWTLEDRSKERRPIKYVSFGFQVKAKAYALCVGGGRLHSRVVRQRGSAH